MIGADRNLALSTVPARSRSALAALFAIDAAMGDVVRTTTDPMLGQIRLAWWRERLEELDGGGRRPPRAATARRTTSGISPGVPAPPRGARRRVGGPVPLDPETSKPHR